MSVKNLKLHIGNWTLDLPACSGVPQPTAPLPVPSINTIQENSSCLSSDLNCLTYLFTYLLANSITPWSRGLPEKLPGPQLLSKFTAFYGTRRFITAFTTARHLSQSWARSNQPMPPHHFSKIHFNIILSSKPVVSSPQVSTPKHCMHLSSPPWLLFVALS